MSVALPNKSVYTQASFWLHQQHSKLINTYLRQGTAF